MAGSNNFGDQEFDLDNLNRQSSDESDENPMNEDN